MNFGKKQALFTFIQQNEILIYLMESYSCNILFHVDNEIIYKFHFYKSSVSKVDQFNFSWEFASFDMWRGF